MSSEHLAELAHDNVEDCVQECPCVSDRQKPAIRRLLALWLSTFFACLDGIVRWLGPIFVVIVWVLISGIVLSWYSILAPYLRVTHSAPFMILQILFAHWLLINIIYHYFKVTTTRPGAPPSLPAEDVQRAVAMGYRYCKKCSLVKPHRCHHCQVCKGCVLNMDHHCPWINNCVGHHNHRHFFLFMAYIWLGCLYVVCVSWTPFWEVRTSAVGFEAVAVHVNDRVQLAFCFVLTAAVLFALGILLFWHVYLVSTGQTTIEFYNNMTLKAEARDRKERWVNPYNFGAARNWRTFLGLVDGRTFARNILLPSAHPPVGDGLTWRTNHHEEASV
eukprot:m.27205 g.27205  ORF g.27205 m.27205 type:complete len:331 (+) comp8997_c0_seq2:74-1066(+)